MNVSIGGIFMRSRRLSNRLVLLELVSSIFCCRTLRRDPQLVVDVMRRLLAQKRSVKRASLIETCSVLRDSASSLCLAMAIRSFIRLRRDLFLINNLRRIISFPLLKYEPFVQAISRKEWPFLTVFIL